MPPVPPIPANLSTPAKSMKPNQKEMAVVEVKINAANAILKTPSTVDRARPDEYYEIEVCEFSQMKFGS